MKKYALLIVLLFSLSNLFSQENVNAKNNLKYLEDQLYLSFTYNIINNKPSEISQNGFSGGFSAGFIKDIPFNVSRNIGIGIGLGYSYNAYIQNLKIVNQNNATVFEVAQDYQSNKLGLNFIEVPFEIRWRNSTAERYKFWRIYTGVKFEYVISSKSKYNDTEKVLILKNIPEIDKFQYGLIISAGYSTWNLYIYYGLKPLFENAEFNGENLNLKEFNLGLKFYIM